MSHLYIFNFKLESLLSLISLIGISLFSGAWLIKFILYPDPRVKFIGFTILSLGIILPLLTFKLNSEWRLKISMSMLGSLFSIYCFEYFLVIRESHFQNSILNKNKGTISTFNQLTNEGKAPTIPAGTLSLAKILTGSSSGSIKTASGSLLPLSNASKRNVLLCEESDGPVVFQSDRYGFNNRDEIWDSETIDIAFLGDSYIEGVCVQRENNICGEVIKKYPNTLNLGIVGHGPLTMLGTLKEYLKIKKPAIVIWCFASNDLYPSLSLEKGNSILTSYLKKDFSQDLMSKQNEVDLILQNFIDLTRNNSTLKHKKMTKKPNLSYSHQIKSMANSKFTRLYRVRQKIFRPYLAKFNSDMNLFEQVVIEANRVVNAWGGKILFVYMPTAERFYKQQLNPLKAEIITLVKNKNIDVVDLEKEFLKDKNPKRFFNNADSHYNATGYSYASKAILKKIDSVK